jgi:hypothetical protein
MESDDGDLELKGNIEIPESEEENDGTLDEPIFVTLKRDILAILTKCTHVMIPRRSKYLLRDWDLWGPLILCLLLAVLLHSNSSDNLKDGSDNQEANGGPHFIEVFVIVWVGSAAVTVNSQLLGGTISFFQSLCALGYCLFPPALAALLSYVMKVLSHSQERTVAYFIIHVLLTVFGFSWAIWASVAFMWDFQPPKRRVLALYPVILFYFAISYMIFSS